MRQLSPEERRRWQSTTLAAPRRRYGADARLLFKLEDLVFGPARTLPKFRARELIARTPYQSWEQAAYLKADQRGNGRSRAEKLFRTVNEDRAEQDNEEWHIILLEEQIAISGVHVNPIRFRLLPQLIAFAVYQQFWLLRVLKPAWSYRLNADIEDHAEYEYAALVAEHPEWETTPFRSVVAAGYGSYDSLADMFRQIGCDEGVHKEISLARTGGSAMTSQAVEIPGYIAGTWDLDPVHSTIGFVARHLMVSKVRGRFTKFEAQIVTAPDPLESSATATIDLSSVDTGNETRDNDLRSENFFDAATHPTMTYRSTGIRPTRGQDSFLVDGELTIRGVTRPIILTVEVNGFGPDPYGGTRAGFSAQGEIDRTEFGITFNAPVPGSGGVMVSERIEIEIEAEAVLRPQQG